MNVYSLISSRLKTYHPTLYFTAWSLDLFICVLQLHGEHTVLQPFRRIELSVHIAIAVLPGTHFHLSQVRHLRVKSLAQAHNIETFQCLHMCLVGSLIDISALSTQRPFSQKISMHLHVGSNANCVCVVRQSNISPSTIFNTRQLVTDI